MSNRQNIEAKERYAEHCDNADIPVFSQPWWLDAVAGADNWEVLLVVKGGEVWASMPIVIRKRFGFTWISQPPLTQTLGPWFRKSEARYSQQLALEKDLSEELISQLPRFHHFTQNWDYSRTNWLPFYWAGFKQTTRYSYVLEDLSDLDRVFKEFEHSKRKNIKKSSALVSVVADIPADEFYDNHVMTLARQGKKIHYSRSFFRRIYSAGYRRGQAKVLGAYDRNDNLHAALFLVSDNRSTYNLISTIDPEYRVIGAASLLVRDAITFAAKRSNVFDFEGSMIEPVERSFRQFGAKQIPYFSVYKTPSRLLRTAFFVRDLLS